MARRALASDPGQLALFDAPPAAPAPAPAAPAVPRLPVAEFRHPQAAREIRLEQHVVAYALKRARRRSIGFVVGADGLSVNAPKWVALGDIESALREKSGWILRKLGEQRERAQRQLAARVDWRDGTVIPFLGEALVVRLDEAVAGAVLQPAAAGPPRHDAAATSAGARRPTLHLGLPRSAPPEQIRELVQGWLQRQARRVFMERCDHYAHQLGVRCTRMSLSSAQTRWGSASADGSIRLSWRLIHFALPTIDYVVAHELAHLREMNHSPRFWSLVRAVLPDYQASRDQLKTQVLPAFE